MTKLEIIESLEKLGVEFDKESHIKKLESLLKKQIAKSEPFPEESDEDGKRIWNSSNGRFEINGVPRYESRFWHQSEGVFKEEDFEEPL